jgi:hypothetical protein
MPRGERGERPAPSYGGRIVARLGRQLVLQAARSN